MSNFMEDIGPKLKDAFKISKSKIFFSFFFAIASLGILIHSDWVFCYMEIRLTCKLIVEPIYWLVQMSPVRLFICGYILASLFPLLKKRTKIIVTILIILLILISFLPLSIFKTYPSYVSNLEHAPNGYTEKEFKGYYSSLVDININRTQSFQLSNYIKSGGDVSNIRTAIKHPTKNLFIYSATTKDGLWGVVTFEMRNFSYDKPKERFDPDSIYPYPEALGTATNVVFWEYPSYILPRSDIFWTGNGLLINVYNRSENKNYLYFYDIKLGTLNKPILENRVMKQIRGVLINPEYPEYFAIRGCHRIGLTCEGDIIAISNSKEIKIVSGFNYIKGDWIGKNLIIQDYDRDLERDNLYLINTTEMNFND